MATIVHESVLERPVDSGPRESSGSMAGVIALILVLVVLFLVFYYGLPAIRAASSPQINVPKSVDVNVHTNGK